jgi:hypothetical protein
MESLTDTNGIRAMNAGTGGMGIRGIGSANEAGDTVPSRLRDWINEWWLFRRRRPMAWMVDGNGDTSEEYRLEFSKF